MSVQIVLILVYTLGYVWKLELQWNKTDMSQGGSRIILKGDPSQ